MFLRFEEVVDVDPRFAENGSERSFGQVFRVMGNGHFPSGAGLAPDFVASGALAIKDESERA